MNLRSTRSTGWFAGLRKKFPDNAQPSSTAAIGQEAKLSNAHESARQYMLYEASQELGGGERHLPLLVAARVVFPAEGDALTIEGQ